VESDGSLVDVEAADGMVSTIDGGGGGDDDGDGCWNGGILPIKERAVDEYSVDSLMMDVRWWPFVKIAQREREAADTPLSTWMRVRAVDRLLV
jgi:hypothetical protein